MFLVGTVEGAPVGPIGYVFAGQKGAAGSNHLVIHRVTTEMVRDHQSEPCYVVRVGLQGATY
jgi:hypothetical protein